MPDGSWVIWSVAEGRRGRRWREVRYRGGSVISSLLLETSPDASFSHMEASTSAGLITLHPEPDLTLHGNVVSVGGVEPVMGWPWERDGVVLLEGSPLCLGAAALRLGRSLREGEARSVGAVVIPLSLALEPAAIAVDHDAPDQWRFDASHPLTIDESGIPQLAEAETWRLEAE